MPVKRKAKLSGKKKTQIEIRQMTLDDLSEVWHLGEKIFTPSPLPFTYRTWNVDELLSLPLSLDACVRGISYLRKSEMTLAFEAKLWKKQQ
jgi:hypothetical protein